jgi:hypothetical protein
MSMPAAASSPAGSGSDHKDTVDPEAWAIVDGKLYFVEAMG